MADNTTLNAGSGGDVIASDDIAGVKHQRVKVEFGADGSATDVSATNPLPIEGADAHDAALTAEPITIGGYAKATAPTNVSADGDAVRAWFDLAGRLQIGDGAGSLTVDGTVTASNTAGDVAHDSADSGSPVKVGGKAANALPTAVANADRSHIITDLWGRQLVTSIDPAMQTSKSFNATTTQTGTDVWDPASGKKIAVTSVIIGTYGTTAGRLILWFGDNADTTYSEGTDQALLKASFAPSTTSKPGLTMNFDPPVYCTTADRELHVTTDAALSVDIVVHGFEW